MTTTPNTSPEAAFWAEWNADADKRAAEIAEELATMAEARRGKTGICFGRTGMTPPPRGGGALRIAPGTQQEAA